MDLPINKTVSFLGGGIHSRTNETLGAIWSEIDLDKKLWTLPAERMKGKVENVVPLTFSVISLLEQAKMFQTSDYVFPGARKGRPLATCP